MQDTATKNTAFSAVGVFLIWPILALSGLWFAPQIRVTLAQTSHSEALSRYYLEIAREVFYKQDIRRAKHKFTITVVVRQFTLNSKGDTLRLDTAIVRGYLTPEARAVADTLKPDSLVVLRSSFVDDEPTLPVLFARPSWDGDFVYSLFPNDPGRGEISIAYDSLAKGGGLSQSGSSGILTLDRSSGVLQSVTLLIRSEDNVSRYSRETLYTTVAGYLIPGRIIEYISKIGIWGNQYEVRETRLLKLSITDSN